MNRFLQVRAPGGPDVLEIVTEEERAPGPGEVRLHIEALGLNRAELLYRQGNYLERTEPPCRIGYEGAGVVAAVGEGVDLAWLGARAGTVPGFSMKKYGLWADSAIVPATTLARTPAGLAMEASAAIWMQYVTAYGGLKLAGEFRAGNHVLITAASSSVGLAAIQIVKDLGGVSIATTRTREKRDELKALGADHVVVTEEENLVARVKAITGGRGVDVVFDPVAGKLVETLASCAAYTARLVIYGGLALEATPFPFRAALNKQLTMRGFTLHQVTRDAGLQAEAVAYITSRIEAGIFVPKIARVFHGLEQVGAAQDYMESNTQVGKIVVVV